MKITPFDPADHLDTPGRITAFLNTALAEDDPTLLQEALGAVARARGMSALAQATGRSRETLYKSLSSAGNPEFRTIVKVLDVLDLVLTVQPKPVARDAAVIEMAAGQLDTDVGRAGKSVWHARGARSSPRAPRAAAKSAAKAATRPVAKAAKAASTKPKPPAVKAPVVKKSVKATSVVASVAVKHASRTPAGKRPRATA